MLFTFFSCRKSVVLLFESKEFVTMGSLTCFNEVKCLVALLYFSACNDQPAVHPRKC